MEEEEKVSAEEAAVAGAKMIGYTVLIVLVLVVAIAVLGSITAPLVVPHG